jgi:pyruvate-formate lyase
MPNRREFKSGIWQDEINVQNFIKENYTPYFGDSTFLSDASVKTKKVWKKCEELLAWESKNGGVLDVETEEISGICSFAPGYIDKENEVIVDLSFSELTELLKQREINLQNSLKQRELTDIKNKLKL